MKVRTKSIPAIPELELRFTFTVTVSPAVTFVLLALAETDADAAFTATEQVRITQSVRRTEISDLIFFINTTSIFLRCCLTYLSKSIEQVIC